LPEAHVEAPTPGSVILAGIVLKLGTYAILRFLVNSFSNISFEFISLVFTIALFGLSYASLVALNQIDIKKIIAYSSVAHMNFSLVGFFSQSLLGLSGSFFMMLGHAITSSALFFGIGVLYDRYKTRLFFYYSGMVTFMPVFAAVYFFFILSNFGFPGSVNFVGEFLISVGLFLVSNFYSILSFLGLFLSLLYSLLMYNHLFFGPFPFLLRFYSDCMRSEFYILFVLAFLIVFYGFFPNLILNFSYISLKKMVFLLVNF
jgi:NADH-quinone oxidoreductase subunit M